MNITSVKRIHQSDWRKKGIPFYRARDITALSKNLNIEEPIFISRDLYEEYSKISGKVQINDLLVTGVGTIGVPLLVQTVPLYFKDGNIIWFQNSNKLIGLFFLYLFKTNTVQKYIHTTTGVGTVPTYTIQSGKNTPVYITSKKEQKDIGTIFQLIDNLISLQQRKVNDLNSMKSALLQDVFPNTQGIKKIKLSTQEWNLQKISSIFKERNQRNKNGMLLSVSISKGVYPFSENDRKDNSSNDKSNYKEVKINDLAYNSMRMWQGAVGVSKYNGIVSPAYTVITPKKEENPNFYYYYFKNKRMLFNFRQHSQGLTSDTWNLKFPLFEKILIQVPSDKEEEKRISSLFKQIDKSIELSKIQIKKLTSIKQFLLQNMFI